MTDATNSFAKLAGILKSVNALLKLEHNVGRNARLYTEFDPKSAKSYFLQAASQLEHLREHLPALYADILPIDIEPGTLMGAPPNQSRFYSREQVQTLVRNVEQVFEIRSHSELATPTPIPDPCVFVTHGSAPDWREVQAYIEKDIRIKTLELAQQPNLGRSVLEKLEQESSKCNSAVIVMTGDDADASGNLRARENVLHEIGYFQAKFGISRVCLLHQEGTNIMSNIHGLVYIPFTKGHVSGTFGALSRELKAFYGL